MTILDGSTYYSDHASVGDSVKVNGTTDYMADMIELMANVNALEVFRGYPATTWLTPLDDYSEFLSYRVVMTGNDIPGAGTHITNAINRVRTNLLGLPAFTSWSFGQYNTTLHITARDEMQNKLGGPMSIDGSTYLGIGGIFPSILVTLLPNGTIFSSGTFGGGIALLQWGTFWDHRWTQYALTPAPNTFAITRNNQFFVSAFAEFLNPIDAPDYDNDGIADEDTDIEMRYYFGAPETDPALNVTTYHNNSTASGWSEPNRPRLQRRVIDMTIAVSDWLVAGSAATTQMTMFLAMDDTFPFQTPDPIFGSTRYYWNGLAKTPFAWGVDT